MRNQGLSNTQIEFRLKQAKAKDQKYENGKIFCSLCTKPHFIAERAHSMFLDSNLGDIGLFPGTAELEQEAIAELSDLLNLKNGAGFIVSGGTEANFLAMYAAREKANLKEPEVIVSELAHFSFNKIARILKIKLIQAKVDSCFNFDLENIESLITKNTIAIVANAGSTELGSIDPIEALSKISVKRAVPLHVDAAFGGLIIPFLKQSGYLVGDFDFSLPGVQTITVDPHKMGMSTIPAGGILFRDKSMLDYIKTETPYLTENYQYTVLGTRSGASVAATWAVFAYLGQEGFRKIVKNCMDLTILLYNQLKAGGFEVLVRPQLNIVAFRSANTKLLVDNLKKKGFFVSYSPHLNCARVVLMPHTTQQHVIDLVDCIKELEAC